MKKLIVIPFLLLAFVLSAQIDSIRIDGITGSDTTICEYLTGNIHSVEFDFTNFDANTATLNAGMAKKAPVYVGFNGGSVILDVSLYSRTANAVTKSRIKVIHIESPGTFCYTLTKNTVTAGTLILY